VEEALRAASVAAECKGATPGRPPMCWGRRRRTWGRRCWGWPPWSSPP